MLSGQGVSDNVGRGYHRPVALLPLNPDELLTTTRAVRKRLDFDKPVSDDVIRECVAAAMQSPSGSNMMTMSFVIVKDAAKRKAVGEIYKACYDMYKSMDGVYIGSIEKGSAEENAQQKRSAASADFLGERMGDAPVLVIPCSAAGMRTEGQPGMFAASMLGNVLPGMWSFMLAARERGLGTAWTTIHLMRGGDKKAAEILGIPDGISQAGLFPIAYTIGTDFKPAKRLPLEPITHWDNW